MNRAVTSASNIFRRALCPGSERLETGLPDEDSAQSREGDLLHAHEADRTLDRSALSADMRDLLAISETLEGEVFATVAAQFGLGPEEPFTQGVEQELYVHRGIRVLIPGHCDKWRHYHRAKLLVIIDKKFGYREVTPAAANQQLRTYAVGGVEQWRDVENVVVAITQPRLSRDERVTLAVYDRAAIEAARAELCAIMDGSAAPDAPLNAGEEQCRYCKAKITCPAFAAKFMAVQEVTKEKLPLCTPDQIGKLLEAIQFADFIADQVRDLGRELAGKGELPGWKLGKVSEVRKIADPERALALLTMGDAKLTREDVLACSAPSVKKLEAKYREKTGCPWKDAREMIDQTLAPVMEITEKKPSLVRVKPGAVVTLD